MPITTGARVVPHRHQHAKSQLVPESSHTATNMPITTGARVVPHRHQHAKSELVPEEDGRSAWSDGTDNHCTIHYISNILHGQTAPTIIAPYITSAIFCMVRRHRQSLHHTLHQQYAAWSDGTDNHYTIHYISNILHGQMAPTIITPLYDDYITLNVTTCIVIYVC